MTTIKRYQRPTVTNKLVSASNDAATVVESMPCIASVPQTPQMTTVRPTQASDDTRSRAAQALKENKTWCKDASYLASSEGRELNEGKELEECPVMPDGSPLAYTIQQLTTWRAISGLPGDFKITPDGKTMNMAGKDPTLFVDGVMLPIAKYYNNEGRLEAIELATLDSDGQLVSLTINIDSMHNDLKKIKAMLSSYQIAYYPATEVALVTYIQKCAKMDSIQTICLVEQAGFVPRQLVYVTHDATLSREGESDENQRRYRLRKLIKQLSYQGSLDEWKTHVAEPVRQSPTMLFPILVMLANVLLNLLQKGTIIVHFYGLSSGGKTTRGQLAQSVVGRATDPSEDGSSAIKKWHGTENALTSLFDRHHGMGLVLDELGSFTCKKFGATIYALTNGQRKGRCDKTGEIIETQSTAALYVISTGELSSDDYLRKTGETVSSGARVRMLNIEVQPDDAVQPGETLAQTKARIDQLKAACSQYFGTALPALAQGLLNLPGAISYEVLQQLVRGRVNECAEHLVPLVDGAAESPLVRRGLDFFAMTLAAGLYSLELGVLPCTEGEILASVVECANRWVASLEEQPDDIARAVRHFQEQLARKRHEFPDMGTPTAKHHMGVIRNKQLLVRVDWFKMLVPQFGKQVLAWLDEQGYLIRNEKDRLTTRIKGRTAGIYDGQYYAFDYDKIMDLEGSDDSEQGAV